MTGFPELESVPAFPLYVKGPTVVLVGMLRGEATHPKITMQ
jgi:hypothetical protein